MLKKLLALAVSAALVIPAFALTSLASNGDIVNVGDGHEKLLTDFENYDDGLRISQSTNKEFICSNDDDSKGGVYQIQAGKGQNGSKGLYEGASAQLGSSGLYSCFEYIPQRDAPTKAVDYTGATDFVFWIDNTLQTNSAKNSSLQIIFEEYDYNSDGTAAMVVNDQDQTVPKVTSRCLTDSADNVYYVMPDGDNAWTQQAGTKGTYISLSNTFKGYVRIPLSSFSCCWSTTDNNSKVDLKHIVDLQMYYGIYPRDIDGAFILDNLGFLGDFQETTATTAEPTTIATTAESTTVAPTTESTTIAPTEESTTEPTSVTTAEPITESSTDASSTTSASAVITTAPVATTASTAAPATTTASLDNTDTTTTPETTATQSPKTGEMPIAAALLTAVALAGVLVVTKKSR